MSLPIVSVETSLKSCLSKMNSEGLRILFIIDENGRLVGSMSDGDLRRFIVNGKHIDDNILVSEVMNNDPVFALETDKYSAVSSKLSKKYNVVPILNQNHQIIQLVGDVDLKLQFGEYEVSNTSSCFIISEIGNNHMGSIELAKEMVDASILAGADCVKFQLRDLDSLYGANFDLDKQDLGVQYTHDLVSRFGLKQHEMAELISYVKKKGAIPLCTPWDLNSVDFLCELGVDGYKVASADFTNVPLLQKLIETRKPLIISTGMTQEDEISEITQILNDNFARFALLHCNSTYPAPYADINLSYMLTLKDRYSEIVGYSGHERGFHVAVAAVAMGAKIIEKHFTFDKDWEGPDHSVSLLPGEFKVMVEYIRDVEKSMGNSQQRSLGQGEMINQANLGKSLYARRVIKEEQKITHEDIIVRSPGGGIPATRLNKLIGKKIFKNKKIDERIELSDFEPPKTLAPYNFVCPNWGLPVRHHDWKGILADFNPKVMEFHLSYRDLLIDSKKIKSADLKDKQLVIHAPELFEDDHIVDLVSDDKKYRQKSFKNIEKVGKFSDEIRGSFANSGPIVVITNVGGFTRDAPLEKHIIHEKYLKLDTILSELESRNQIEIVPQTMPPFPWHFGGQRFHNLFVDPAEIENFCSVTKRRICLDLSHTLLACNNLNKSFISSVEGLMPHVAHIHVADASGDGEEGLQIFDGIIDWEHVSIIMQNYKHKFTWIPEIWQGHRDNNSGFRIALEKLRTLI